MKQFISLLFIVSLFIPAVVLANRSGNDHFHEEMKEVTQPFHIENVNLAANEVLLEVHGIVCSFCSKGVQNKVSKLPFVDTSKYIDGSKVEIDEQRVTVAIKPGMTADIKALYKAVKSGGYEPVAAYALGKDNTIVKLNIEE